MNTLFLDLASHQNLIALVSDSVTATQVGEKWSDADIAVVLASVVPDLSAVNRIACVIGPGGFTSLRIAATAANVLSDQLNVPSAGIHLADLYAARTEGDPLWLHSTKRDQLFIKGDKWAEPSCEHIDVISSLPNDGAWTGELIEEHETLVTNQGLTAAKLTPLDDVLPSFIEGLTYDDYLLEPWYGRGW